MLSDEECKKILNRNGGNYTDDQVRNIKEFLLLLAQVEVRTIEITNSDENCSYNEPGKQR
jgi:hypothetical protein